MPSGEIEIRFVKSAPTNDIVALYKDAGWWDERFNDAESWAPGVVSGSFRFAGAFDGERLIGMARALSDGVSDAVIVDVTVLKEYRGRGIARRVVDTLVDELERLEIDWITGIGEPDALPFYKKTGVEVMEGYMPLRFRGERSKNGF